LDGSDQARAHLGACEPDLVLLDVHLPEGSGLAFARELATGHAGAGVVMVSGQDDLAVAEIALDAGAYGYVTKPFKRNELVIAVRYALHRRQRDHESSRHRAMLEDRVVERTVAAMTPLTSCAWPTRRPSCASPRRSNTATLKPVRTSSG
jgi:DNA-binding response OmpR family regulator